jgi:large subunit ribosomal protein L21
MKYAIVEIGGHQAWVEEGKYFLSNKISKDQGTNLLFNRILLIKNNEDSFFGDPHLNNSYIYAKILQHLSGSKINVFKMRSKKKYRRKKGHRQQLTKLLITYIKI